MTTLFISDLHLQASRPDITALFLRFLRETAINAQALYILGDLFEVWIGDDEQDELSTQVSQALHYLAHTKNLPIYFMPGNRDFLIGKVFCVQSGCQLLTDPTLIQLYGTPILIMHGDTLCTLDKKYQLYRRAVHHPIVRRLFLSLPLSWRRKIATKLRQGSQQHTRTTADYVMDATQSDIEQVMHQCSTRYLIHGHTHRPAIHQFSLNDQLATRAVLGAWHDNGSVLHCDSGPPNYPLLLTLQSFN